MSASTVDQIPQRDTRLDRAKAIAIALVLFWHLQPVQIVQGSDATLLTRALRFGIAQFYLQISLVAVPVFLMTSLFLFYQKAAASGLPYLIKRCRRLAELFVFWSGFQFLAYFAVLALLSAFHEQYSHSISRIPVWRLVTGGGPPLPVVGDSVFYFFFVLLVLAPASFGFLIFRRAGRVFTLTGVSAVIFSMVYFEWLGSNGRVVPYWRMDNFLLYVPLSYFLWRSDPARLRRYVPWLCVGFVLFSVQDIFLREKGYDSGAYSRVSIVFGSLALISALLQFRASSPRAAISFLSRYSMGIFAIHKYWHLLVISIVREFALPGPANSVVAPFDFRVASVSLIALCLTFASVYFGGPTRLGRFLM